MIESGVHDLVERHMAIGWLSTGTSGGHRCRRSSRRSGLAGPLASPEPRRKTGRNRITVTRSQRAGTGSELRIHVRIARYFPRAEGIGIRLPVGGLIIDDIGFRKELPDFDRLVGANLAAASMHHNRIEHR